MNMACAIIAGGKNTRMNGTNKAFIKVDNVPIIQRILYILKELFDEIILVTNDKRDFGIYENKLYIVSDIIEGIGPLGGIHAALSSTTKEAVFTVACDMPFLHSQGVAKIISHFQKKQCDALLPRIGDYIEPLHAIYEKKLADDILIYAKNSSNYSVRGFLETVDICYWDVDDIDFYRKVFKNINSPDDLREANEEGTSRNGTAKMDKLYSATNA